MDLLDKRSLGATLDAVNEAIFFADRIPKSEARRVASWLATRQGMPGSYAEMFAPTELDYRRGITLFTGERIESGAATGHILGEEACRAVILLDARVREASVALERATAAMVRRLRSSETASGRRGFYCCGACTASLWRHLAAGGLDSQTRRLSSGIDHLRELRDGHGRWRRFPFYYTLLALAEIPGRSSRSEMRYAAPSCERLLARSPRGGKIDRRRRAVAERVLALV